MAQSLKLGNAILVDGCLGHAERNNKLPSIRNQKTALDLQMAECTPRTVTCNHDCLKFFSQKSCYGTFRPLNIVGFMCDPMLLYWSLPSMEFCISSLKMLTHSTMSMCFYHCSIKSRGALCYVLLTLQSFQRNTSP